jgi:hypothetical protein
MTNLLDGYSFPIFLQMTPNQVVWHGMMDGYSFPDFSSSDSQPGSMA